jgi:hypothetical protein
MASSRCGLISVTILRRITLIVEQKRVAHFAEERTEIEIEWLEVKT